MLAARRLTEGVAGIARLHELVAGHMDGDDPAQVVLAIETDRGPWLRALVAAGYRVLAVNPKQAARHREVVAVSGKKDDTFDAAALADMARTRRHQLRAVAAGSDEAEAVKVAAGHIRSWCGSGPGTRCGCARRWGSTSRPRWRPTRS